MKYFINKSIYRDKLSFGLLIICFALIIFSAVNLSFIYGRYTEANDSLHRYSNYSKGAIYPVIASFESVWTKDFFLSLISDIQSFETEKKELMVYTSINDEFKYTGIVLDFSDNYLKDLEVVYDKRKNVPGVYIGSDVMSYYESAKKKYIVFSGNTYLVKGVYKDLLNSEKNKQIVFPMNIFSSNMVDKLIDDAYVISYQSQSAYFFIASNNDIESEIQAFLKKYEINNNLEVDIEPLSYSDDIYGIGDIQVLGAYIITIFAVISGISVFALWIKRISKEICIRRLWGASNFKIVLNMISYIMKVIIVSLPIALFLILIGNQLSDEKIYDFKFIVYESLYTGIIIVLVTIILFIYFIIHINMNNHFKGVT